MDKNAHHHPWQLRKPTSLKRRKQISSDSNDDYYYTHPPSPQQANSLTTISSNLSSTATSTSTIPAPQLIPRGPLICSDNFEKWNDRSFTWTRPTPPVSSLSTAVTTVSTSLSAETKNNVNETLSSPLSNVIGQICENKATDVVHDDVDDDDDSCFASATTNMKKFPEASEMRTVFGSHEHLRSRKVSLTGSLRSLPLAGDAGQQEIFELLRQAEEVNRIANRSNRTAIF
jgi:hypothetical protein